MRSSIEYTEFPENMRLGTLNMLPGISLLMWNTPSFQKELLEPVTSIALNAPIFGNQPIDIFRKSDSTANESGESDSKSSLGFLLMVESGSAA